jgi:predicted amidohydrolase
MLRIALAQMRIDYTDTAANIKTGMAMINSAIESKCSVIVLPELWSTGFQLDRRVEFSELNLGLIQDLQNISTKRKIEIIGSYVRNNNGYHNDFVAIQPNSLEFHYAKIHLFPALQEPIFLEPGKEICVYPSTLGQTGASICFDLRFPNHFQQLYTRGALYHILPAHWPQERISHWDILLKARAIETISYVIAVNSTGQSRSLAFGGHSSVISPDGEIILQAEGNKEDVFIVDIDESLIKTTRDCYPFLTEQ